ncbi:hypothetical protein [Cyanobacterium aponinum]|nr:hypothetical protein [Cyanobacterium aponinum]
MVKLKLNRLFISAILIVSFCGFVIVKLQKPLLNKEKIETAQDFLRKESITQSQLDLIHRFPTLGFQNLIADKLFLDFIQYYGNAQARQVTGYGLLPDFYQLIVKRDPRFVTAYLTLDPATSLFAGRPDLSVEYLNFGLKYISPEQPLAYQIWLFKAIDELLFLGKTEEARKSFEMAAKWAKKANTPQTLAFSQRYAETAEFLKQNPDSKKARASAWLMILGNARDDQVRQIALANLEQLGAKITVNGNQFSVDIPEN